MKKKISYLAALAVLGVGLAACEGVYGPNDPRGLYAAHPGCSAHGYGKYDENAYPDCKLPPGTKVVGGLVVKKE